MKKKLSQLNVASCVLIVTLLCVAIGIGILANNLFYQHHRAAQCMQYIPMNLEPKDEWNAGLMLEDSLADGFLGDGVYWAPDGSAYRTFSDLDCVACYKDGILDRIIVGCYSLHGDRYWLERKVPE